MIPPIIIKAPVLDARTAMLALECSEWELMGMIEDGTLLFVWDIRAVGLRRKLIRVAATSVAAVHAKTKETDDIEEVIHTIFPRPFQYFPLQSVARKLHCSTQLIESLVAGRQGPVSLPGRVDSNHPMKITRESLVKFLKARRVA